MPSSIADLICDSLWDITMLRLETVHTQFEA